MPQVLGSTELAKRRRTIYFRAENSNVSEQKVGTTFARKLGKCSRVFTPATRWSPHDPHLTNACPGCLVCVVGALGRFLSCKGVNGSSENGAFEAQPEIQNKLGTFVIHHVAVTTMH